MLAGHVAPASCWLPSVSCVRPKHRRSPTRRACLSKKIAFTCFASLPVPSSLCAVATSSARCEGTDCRHPSNLPWLYSRRRRVAEGNMTATTIGGKKVLSFLRMLVLAAIDVVSLSLSGLRPYSPSFLLYKSVWLISYKGTDLPLLQASTVLRCFP